MQENDTITRVPNIRIGHAQDFDAITGCTVLLCESGAVGGVDQRGGAPGTRETDLLRPMHLVEHVHAVLLSGGSAFGLAAADGVMAYLEERQIGVNVGVTHVPIVPSAILFDLDIGSAHIRPDPAMGRLACEAASSGPVLQGSVGAGTGAQVGRMFGISASMKGGIGSAAVSIGGGVEVGALIAVNAFGDVVDPANGETLAGLRDPARQGVLPGTLEVMRSMSGQVRGGAVRNTVIGVVATNARLTREQANKVAQMAHNGIARAIRPAHTMFDGDTIFALSTGDRPADVNLVGAYAAEMVASAIVNGVRHADSLGGCMSLLEFIEKR